MTAFHDTSKSQYNASKFSSRLIVLCSAALLVAGAAQAAATYTTEDNGATIVVTVDAEGATLDSSQIVAGVTKIAKRGPGKLTSVAIASYTGDFDIEEGIWCCTDAKHFGATSTTANSGTIHVRDGASIEYAGSNKYSGAISGKTVHLYGAAASGATEGAKIFLSSNIQMADPGFGKNMTIVLHDNATFYSRNRFTLNGTFDLGGKVLTLKNQAHDFGGVVTNGGSVVISSSTTWMTQSTAITFAADCAATAFVQIDGGTFNIKDKRTYANGWTIKNNGGTITCNTQRSYTATDIGIWEGPIELSGSANAANYGAKIGGWGISNTVLSAKGPISGTGSLLVGPGWLNLHNAVNTYSGAVTVRGKGTKRTPGDNENVVPPGSGGIGIWNGASAFTSASSITLEDSARVEFMDDVAASVGALTFVGDKSTFTNGDPGDDTQSIKGGSAENRSTIAGLSKTGTNTLVVSSPAHFTGTATISAGVLKIPYRSVRGTPGLFETHVMPNTVDTWTDIQYIYEPTAAYYKLFIPWNSTYLSHCYTTEKGVCAVGAQRAYKGLINTSNVGWDDGYVATLPSNKKSGRNAWWYSGYVWNNTDAPVTYTVWSGASTGSAIWLGDDHSTSIQLKVGAGNTQHRKEAADAQEITLQPGATKIDIVIVGNDANYWCLSVPSNGERHGLVYAPTSACTAEHLNELIVNYYDNASTANTNALSAALSQFSEFKDNSGIGELFTVDVYSNADADKKVALLPVFDDLKFENGTKLDLDGNLDFVVKNLTGSPNVENAVRMTITNNWTICAEDFPKADSSVRRKMMVAGKLVFAEGATFSVDVENDIARSQSGVVVATATGGIEGCPKQASGLTKKWRLVAIGNDLYLRSNSGCMLIIR